MHTSTKSWYLGLGILALVVMASVVARGQSAGTAPDPSGVSAPRTEATVQDPDVPANGPALSPPSGELLDPRTALGTAFTYQGQLKQAGTPLNNTADFQFSLWGAAGGGNQIGPTVPVDNVTVAGGLFTVPIDFGSNYYFSEALWLEIAVRAPAGSGGFTTLTPRQSLTATPNALHAQFATTAGSIQNGVTGGGPPNTLAKFTGGSAIGASDVWDTGAGVGIGTNTPKATLDVAGAARVESLQITTGAALQTSVVAWGSNTNGQVNVPSLNTGFVAVAGGSSHSLGVRADGSIIAWGSNSDGQCNVPAPNTGFVAAAGGGGNGHSLGLTAGGSIVAWGYNYYGQCNVPAPNTGFVAVAAGTFHSLGVRADGSIAAWGWNSSGQCNVPSPNTGFVAVSGGNSHSLGLKADGSIVAWGSNNYGERDVPAPNTDFVGVAAGGGGHSLGVKGDGTIVAWGANNFGQSNVPAPNTGFVAVAAGWGHSLGLKADGSIVAWGNNSSGQCNVPAPNTGFLAVAGGSGHSLGLRGTIGTPALRLDVDAAYKPGSGHWTISSDRRLKRNVHPLHEALDRLLGLHGVTFEWRNPLTQGGRFGPQIGLIADEVAGVFPDWIGTGPDGYQTLTVSGFEALTAEALRELRAEKDAQIKQLRCENAELRARLDRLERMLTTSANEKGAAR